MSEDVGYMSNDLDWACQSGTSSGSRGSNWIGITGMVIGILALGTALYAAFAPRNVVEQTSQKVRSALKRGAEKARARGQEIMENVPEAVHAGSHSSPSQ